MVPLDAPNGQNWSSFTCQFLAMGQANQNWGAQRDRKKSSNLVLTILTLGGGFNPLGKYYSNWIIFPNRDVNRKYLKPPHRTASF